MIIQFVTTVLFSVHVHVIVNVCLLYCTLVCGWCLTEPKPTGGVGNVVREAIS